MPARSYLLAAALATVALPAAAQQSTPPATPQTPALPATPATPANLGVPSAPGEPTVNGRRRQPTQQEIAGKLPTQTAGRVSPRPGMPVPPPSAAQTETDRLYDEIMRRAAPPGGRAR